MSAKINSLNLIRTYLEIAGGDFAFRHVEHEDVFVGDVVAVAAEESHAVMAHFATVVVGNLVLFALEGDMFPAEADLGAML